MKIKIPNWGIDGLLSGFGYLFSIVVSLYVYKSLWSSGSVELLIGWVLIFELSQFLLLSDFGFSHSFISSCQKNRNFLNQENSAKLRVTLFFIGLIAGIIVVLAAMLLAAWHAVGSKNIMFLSGSLAISIASYAETAILRVQSQQRKITESIVASQCLYLLLVVLLSNHPIEAISVGGAARSFLSWVMQYRATRIAFSRNVLGISAIKPGVAGLNFSYFCLFFLDLALLNLLKIPGGEIALLIFSRKYFDIVRGGVDAVYQASIIWNKNSIEKYLKLFIVLIFFISLSIFSLLMNLLFSDIKFDAESVAIVCFYFCSISIFRAFCIDEIFNSNGNAIFLIILSLISKILFFLVALMGFGVTTANLTQTVVLSTGTAFLATRRYRSHG